MGQNSARQSTIDSSLLQSQFGEFATSGVTDSKFGSNRDDISMSTTTFLDLDTQGDLQYIPAIKQHIFLKKGGGLLGKQNQPRMLKIHQNGQISYHKNNEMRGSIQINENTEVGYVQGSEWYIKNPEREFIFIEKNNDRNKVNEWLDQIREIIAEMRGKDN